MEFNFLADGSGASESGTGTGTAANGVSSSMNGGQSRDIDTLTAIIDNLQSLFSRHFRDIRESINSNRSSLNDKFVLSIQNHIESCENELNHAVSPSEAERFLATNMGRIQLEINALQEERRQWKEKERQGYEMIQSLRTKNGQLEMKLKQMGIESQRHKEDQLKWHQERAQGYELMAGYQDQLKVLKEPHLQGNGQIVRPENDDSSGGPDAQAYNGDKDPRAEVSRLKEIIDMGKSRMYKLQEEKRSLTDQNAKLSEDLKEARQLMKEKGIRTLYRSESKGNWNKDDLDALKEAMAEELAAMAKQELANKFAKQDELYWQSHPNDENKLRQSHQSHQNGIPTTSTVSSSTTGMGALTEGNEEDADGDKNPLSNNHNNPSQEFAHATNSIAIKRKARESKLYRSESKSKWTDDDLAEIKKEMFSHLQDLKKKQLAEMYEQQDKLRHADGSSSEHNDVRNDPSRAYGHDGEDPLNDVAAADGPSSSSSILDVPQKLSRHEAMKSEQIIQMQEELQRELRLQHKEMMKAFIEREDKLRWDKENANKNQDGTNLISTDDHRQMTLESMEKKHEEMLRDLKKQSKQELAKMFAKQFNLRAGNENDNDDDENDKNSRFPHAIQEMAVSHESGMHHGTTAAEEPQQSGIRRHSLAMKDYDEDELERVKEEMMEQIRIAQKKELARMMETNDQRWDPSNHTVDIHKDYDEDESDHGDIDGYGDGDGPMETGHEEEVSENLHAIEEDDIPVSSSHPIMSRESDSPEEINMADINGRPSVRLEEMNEFKEWRTSMNHRISDLQESFEKVSREKARLAEALSLNESMEKKYREKIDDLEESVRAMRKEIRQLENSKIVLARRTSESIDYLRDIIKFQTTGHPFNPSNSGIASASRSSVKMDDSTLFD